MGRKLVFQLPVTKARKSKAKSKNEALNQILGGMRAARHTIDGKLRAAGDGGNCCERSVVRDKEKLK